jgi:hypothetical protein
MHGWDMVKGAEWMRHCLGGEHNIPHQCAVSQINGTEALGGYAQGSCALRLRVPPGVVRRSI